MYMKGLPFEDKVDLFSPLCSKYQSEYACNNTQCITLSASRCNKMHIWFDCLLFLSFFVCGFPNMYFSDNVFCTWGWFLTLTRFRNSFFVLLIIFMWVATPCLKGFQCIGSLFRVYMSLLARTLFEKHNREVCFMLIQNGRMNSCW